MVFTKTTSPSGISIDQNEAFCFFLKHPTSGYTHSEPPVSNCIRYLLEKNSPAFNSYDVHYWMNSNTAKEITDLIDSALVQLVESGEITLKDNLVCFRDSRVEIKESKEESPKFLALLQSKSKNMTTQQDPYVIHLQDNAKKFKISFKDGKTTGEAYSVTNTLRLSITPATGGGPSNPTYEAVLNHLLLDKKDDSFASTSSWLPDPRISAVFHHHLNETLESVLISQDKKVTLKFRGSRDFTFDKDISDALLANPSFFPKMKELMEKIDNDNDNKSNPFFVSPEEIKEYNLRKETETTGIRSTSFSANLKQNGFIHFSVDSDPKIGSLINFILHGVKTGFYIDNHLNDPEMICLIKYYLSENPNLVQAYATPDQLIEIQKRKSLTPQESKPATDSESSLDNQQKSQDKKTMTSPKTTFTDRSKTNFKEMLYHTGADQGAKITQEIVCEILGKGMSSIEQAILLKAFSTPEGAAMIKLFAGTVLPHAPMLGDYVQNNQHMLKIADALQIQGGSALMSSCADVVREKLMPKLTGFNSTISQLQRLENEESSTKTRVASEEVSSHESERESLADSEAAAQNQNVSGASAFFGASLVGR